MNKFKEAQIELLTAINTKFDHVNDKLSSLDGDVKSLKGGWKDRFTIIFGFMTLSLAIYFGIHH